MKKFFLYLIENNIEVGNFSYSVQGRDYQLKDIEIHKPNFGTYSYLIKSYEIKNSINTHLHDKFLKHFIFVQVPSFIRKMQTVRNESVHGSSTSFKECNNIRNIVMGIGEVSILKELDRNKSLLA